MNSAQRCLFNKRTGAEIWLILYSPIYLLPCRSMPTWRKGHSPICTKVSYKLTTALLLVFFVGFASISLLYYKVIFCDSTRSFPWTYMNASVWKLQQNWVFLAFCHVPSPFHLHRCLWTHTHMDTHVCSHHLEGRNTYFSSNKWNWLLVILIGENVKQRTGQIGNRFPLERTRGNNYQNAIPNLVELYHWRMRVRKTNLHK